MPPIQNRNTHLEIGKSCTMVVSDEYPKGLARGLVCPCARCCPKLPKSSLKLGGGSPTNQKPRKTTILEHEMIKIISVLPQIDAKVPTNYGPSQSKAWKITTPNTKWKNIIHALPQIDKNFPQIRGR